MTKAIAVKLNKQLKKALQVTGVLEHQDIIKYVRTMKAISTIRRNGWLNTD